MATALPEQGQAILMAPELSGLSVLVDGEKLGEKTAELLSFDRRLDYRAGMLYTDSLWKSGTRTLRVEQRALVSLVERTILQIELDIHVLEGDAAVEVLALVPNDDGVEPDAAAASLTEAPAFYTDAPKGAISRADSWTSGGIDCAVWTVPSSGMKLGTASLLERLTPRETSGSKQTTSVRSTVAFVRNELDGSGVDRPLAQEAADLLRSADLAGLPSAQREELDAFWDRADVSVQSEDGTQGPLRWNLFQPMQCFHMISRSGVPAKALTGIGYDGHYFWDQEIYVLPYAIYVDPLAAREALEHRGAMLNIARKRAKDLSQRGALFPWRTIMGEEASPYFPAGTAQYHIDADIAWTVMRYATATGDIDFMAGDGIDILVETARLWADLGFWNEVPVEGGVERRFEIHGVTGPDEYTALVNNNYYTNLMAAENLRGAVKWLQKFRRDDPEVYEQIKVRLDLADGEIAEFTRDADGMYLPWDEQRGVHPQDDTFLSKKEWDLAGTPASGFPLMFNHHNLVIYRHQVLKQANVVAVHSLLPRSTSQSKKAADFAYYDPLTSGDSSLSAVAQCIVAADVGEDQLALHYFRHALDVDLRDLHNNSALGLHSASLGGVWSAVVTGFGGFCDQDGTYSIDPRLPEEWDELTYHVMVEGLLLRVRVDHEWVTVTAQPAPITWVDESRTLSIQILEEHVELDEGTAVRVPQQ